MGFEHHRNFSLNFNQSNCRLSMENEMGIHHLIYLIYQSKASLSDLFSYKLPSLSPIGKLLSEQLSPVVEMVFQSANAGSCLCLLLLPLNSCGRPCSAAMVEPPSFSQRVAFLNLAPHAVAPTSSTTTLVAGSEGDPDQLIGDEKRLVHTGPNPLHNK